MSMCALSLFSCNDIIFDNYHKRRHPEAFSTFYIGVPVLCAICFLFARAMDSYTMCLIQSALHCKADRVVLPCTHEVLPVKKIKCPTMQYIGNTGNA